MKAPRNAAVTSSYLFLRKDGKTLLIKRQNTGYEDGNYQVPAGHVDAGELPTQAIIREAREEIGIDLASENLKFVHTSFRPKHDNTGDRVDYFFEASRWRGEVINAEPHKCSELKWADSNEFPPNITLHIRVALEAVERGEPFSEIGIDRLKEAGLYKL